MAARVCPPCRRAKQHEEKIIGGEKDRLRKNARRGLQNCRLHHILNIEANDNVKTLDRLAAEQRRLKGTKERKKAPPKNRGFFIVAFLNSISYCDNT